MNSAGSLAPVMSMPSSNRLKQGLITMQPWIKTAITRTEGPRVPYQFAGKEVYIRSALRTAGVFCEGERANLWFDACHMRSADARKRYITEPSRMPENRRAVADWPPQRFLSWADKTGENTKKYIEWLLARGGHPEQAANLWFDRTCAGILRIASAIQPQQMEEASALALARHIYSYK